MAESQTGAGTSRPPVPSRRELLAAGINVLVAIPLERQIPSESFPALWQIAMQGYPLLSRPYSRTDVNRNEFAATLLEHPEFTHLAMFDLDQIHPPDAVERMARWVMADREKLVIGGLHFRRGAPFDPLVFMRDDGGSYHAIAEWDEGLFAAHAIGHGTLLVHRSVFERIPRPWWAYAYPNGTWQTSEDIWFCQRCWEAGIPIWVDTTLSSPHLISSTVDLDSHQRWLADHPEAVIRPLHAKAE